MGEILLTQIDRVCIMCLRKGGAGMGLPERLVEIREKNGYTRKRLCEELGRPYATVTKYETGEREPGHGYIIDIAKKFGVTTDYILGIDTKKSPEPVVIDSEEVQECEKWLTDLLVSKGYIKPGEDISDRDADFLIHWIGLLDAWIAGNG